MAHLTNNDTRVLGAIFDPEASLETAYHSTVPEHPSYDARTMQRIKSTEHEALSLLNHAHPPASDLTRAIAMFNRVIEDYPKYAPAYSNRAQTKRMALGTEDVFSDVGTLDDIFDDLDTAIQLALPDVTSAAEIISHDDRNALAAACTHRGFLVYEASKLAASSGPLSSAKSISGLNAEQLEETASKDFAIGGRFGNKIAKQMAVKTNPYAKLCSGIVKESMRREMESYQSNALPLSSMIG